MITLFTIGFTKKSAEHFFELLKKYHVKKIIDIRINNTSQLAGFAKGVDLSYFAQQICGIEYTHIIDFAPTKELLSDYQKKNIDWKGYQQIYRKLIENRKNIILKILMVHVFYVAKRHQNNVIEDCWLNTLKSFIQLTLILSILNNTIKILAFHYEKTLYLFSKFLQICRSLFGRD